MGAQKTAGTWYLSKTSLGGWLPGPSSQLRKACSLHPLLPSGWSKLHDPRFTQRPVQGFPPPQAHLPQPVFSSHSQTGPAEWALAPEPELASRTSYIMYGSQVKRKYKTSFSKSIENVKTTTTKTKMKIK
ncbi:unnamed protein product [Rangifer tarandus platyrhynchus]|uniref:Uncharacterized protein n=2 Tax=Rangifer tarandus platyrhynchus TaxID=3082113 RepID=A0AC59Z547_RANTA|nr:unnamed protein product [Rangifer tarandus platyrhynchus]